MVMWNLVAHGVKWAARGIDAFSQTDAGKKTAEVTGRAFAAAKEASQDAVRAYKDSKNSTRPNGGGLRGVRWVEGALVVMATDGRVGRVVRYLQANEVGGESGGTGFTPLVLVDLLQFTNEMDRYIFIHESGLRAV